MADSLNPALLLCPLWPKQPRDCLARYGTTRDLNWKQSSNRALDLPMNSKPSPNRNPAIPSTALFPHQSLSLPCMDRFARSLLPERWLHLRRCLASFDWCQYPSHPTHREALRSTSTPTILESASIPAFVMVAFSLVRGTFPVFRMPSLSTRRVV